MTSPSLRIDVEAWTQELIRVWQPARILEVRNQGTLGLLFIASIRSGLTLHLRVQWTGVDRCTLWQGQRYVLWDCALGFLSTPSSKERDEWEAQMHGLIRRNCFLMGCDVSATEEEKRQWWQEREDSKTSQP